MERLYKETLEAIYGLTINHGLMIGILESLVIAMSKFKLEEIKDPSFLKNLSVHDLEILASEIRTFLIQSISKDRWSSVK